MVCFVILVEVVPVIVMAHPVVAQMETHRLLQVLILNVKNAVVVAVAENAMEPAKFILLALIMVHLLTRSVHLVMAQENVICAMVQVVINKSANYQFENSFKVIELKGL